MNIPRNTGSSVSPVNAHATGARDVLRLLTLAAVVLLVLFRTPQPDAEPLQTIIAQSAQTSDGGTTR